LFLAAVHGVPLFVLGDAGLGHGSVGRRWAPGGACRCRKAAAVGEGGRGAGLRCRVADVLELWQAVLVARYRRRRTR
jgi:hypothetical protein